MADDDDRVVLLTCEDGPVDGDGARSPRGRGFAAWWPGPERVGPRGRDPGGWPATRVVAVPARPGRADVDPLLADPGVARLVVAGTDADLAAVLARLLRRNRLDVEVAYLPAERGSAAARVWGLPHGAAAVALARRGVARPAPLVRDDAGGVLVGRAEVRGPHGEVYCDGDLVLRGAARRLLVTPWPDTPPIAPPTSGEAAGPAVAGPAPPAVAVRAGRSAALPDGRARPLPPTARAGTGSGVGRAVQLGCLPATVVHDGVVHPRPVTRWAWYRHVADWLLVRPGR